MLSSRMLWETELVSIDLPQLEREGMICVKAWLYVKAIWDFVGLNLKRRNFTTTGCLLLKLSVVFNHQIDHDMYSPSADLMSSTN